MSKTRTTLRTLRDAKAMYEREGVEICALENSGGQHWRVRALYMGQHFLMFFANSASCKRAMLNHRATLRQIKRQIEQGIFKP